jgi:hypothetical protein
MFVIFRLYNKNLSICYTCVCSGCIGCRERGGVSARYTHIPYSLIYSTHNGDDAPQNTFLCLIVYIYNFFYYYFILKHNGMSSTPPPPPKKRKVINLAATRTGLLHGFKSSLFSVGHLYTVAYVNSDISQHTYVSEDIRRHWMAIFPCKRFGRLMLVKNAECIEFETLTAAVSGDSDSSHASKWSWYAAW